MDYIIYTTEGFTKTQYEDDIENCQILDFQYDSKLTKEEALQLYLTDNNTDKTGFNKHEIRIDVRISDKICHSITELIAYVQNNNLETKDEDINSHLDKLTKYFNL